MTSWQLSSVPDFSGVAGPVLLVVMDGVGYGQRDESGGVWLARTHILDGLHQACPHAPLLAHGVSVGMPSDADMGNSEVGHNALGSGRIFDQGAKLVAQAIADGKLFAGKGWNEIVGNALAKGSTLHFIGLFSD